MKVLDRDLGPDFEQISVYFLSDLHLGDPLCDSGLAREMLREIETEPSAFLVCNGDLVNNAIKTSVSDTYGECITPEEQIQAAIHLLEPVKDRILVMADGNHEDRTYKLTGLSPTRQIARELFGSGKDDVYARGAWMLFASFGKNLGRDNRRTIYSLYGIHGTGGGRRAGGKANRLEDLSTVVNADIFVHSHTHQPFLLPLVSMAVDYRNRKVVEKDSVAVNTNAWLEYGGYGAKGGYRPVSRRYPRIVLSGRQRRWEAAF